MDVLGRRVAPRGVAGLTTYDTSVAQSIQIGLKSRAIQCIKDVVPQYNNEFRVVRWYARV
jgi:hypothetical protein